MTVLDILKKVYRKYEGDVEYPDFEDEDMQLYFSLLCDSLDEWDSEFPDARETYDTLAHAIDGDKTMLAGKTMYLAPSNFASPSSALYIGDTVYTFVTQDELTKRKGEENSTKVFTVHGYPGAYRLEFYPAPDGAGTGTLEYMYWRTTNKPVTGSSVIEIGRPLYCLYSILEALYFDDVNNKRLAQEYGEMKTKEIKKEKMRLFTKARNQVKPSGFGFGQ